MSSKRARAINAGSADQDAHIDKKQRVKGADATGDYTELVITAKPMRDVNLRKQAVCTRGKVRFPNTLAKFVQRTGPNEYTNAECLVLTEYTGGSAELKKGRYRVTGGFGKEGDAGPRLAPDCVEVNGGIDMSYEHGDGDALTLRVGSEAALDLLCDNPGLVVTLHIYDARVVRLRGRCRSVSIIERGTPGDTLVDCSGLEGVADDAITISFGCEPEFAYDDYAQTYIAYPSGECKRHVSNAKDEEWGPARIIVADLRKRHVRFPQPCWLRELRDDEDDGFISYDMTV